VLAAVGLLVGLFAARLCLTQQPIRFHVYWVVLPLTVAAAFWLLRRANTMTRPRWAVAWGAVLVADLWALAWPLVAVRPEADIYPRSVLADYLADHAGEHGRVLDLDLPGAAPDSFGSSTPLGTGGPLAMMHGLESLRGYNPLDNLHYKEYLQFITGEDRPLHPLDGPLTFPVISNFPTRPVLSTSTVGLLGSPSGQGPLLAATGLMPGRTDAPIKNRSLLDLLGTRYLVAPVDDTRERDGWQLCCEDAQPLCFDFIAGGGMRPLPRYAVYENTRVLPRAFVVPHAAPLPPRPGVLAALTRTDFRATVLLAEYEPTAENPSLGRVRSAVVEDYRPNRVTVRVAGDAPGYLVLTDVWYPGWTCTLDGALARLYRADFLFRAVRVPAGEHEVTFTFAPASYQRGRRVSVLALAGAAATFLLSWAACRARRAATPPAVRRSYAMPATAGSPAAGSPER
jgi:hypothetical protein